MAPSESSEAVRQASAPGREVAHRPGPGLTDATHEWVRAHEDENWPNYKNGDRARLLTEVLFPFHSIYLTVMRARSRINPRLRAVRYNVDPGQQRRPAPARRPDAPAPGTPLSPTASAPSGSTSTASAPAPTAGATRTAATPSSPAECADG
jgi:hypothetical protein